MDSLDAPKPPQEASKTKTTFNPEQKKLQEAPRKEISSMEAKKFGNFYSTVIDSAINRGEIDTSGLLDTTEPTQALADTIALSTTEHRKGQHMLATVKQMDAQAFLKQAFPEDKVLQGTYELKELGEGIYVVLADEASFHNLFPKKASATAVKVADGVSFTFIRTSPNNPQHTEKALTENVPHEANHILWSYLQKDGIVESDEPNQVVKGAFLFYQDELAARVVSDGALSAYPHPSLTSNDNINLLTQAEQDIARSTFETVGNLNNILEEITTRSRQDSEFKKISLLLPLIRSKTFSELQEYLEDIRDSLPLPGVSIDNNVSDGWNVV